jgi:nitrogen fixation-related uncharacterized protein
MGLIQIDFLSIVLGYMIGVALMWSLCSTFYGENNERSEKDSANTRPRYDRRYHMLYGDSPE